MDNGDSEPLDIMQKRKVSDYFLDAIPVYGLARVISTVRRYGIAVEEQRKADPGMERPPLDQYYLLMGLLQGAEFVFLYKIADRLL